MACYFGKPAFTLLQTRCYAAVYHLHQGPNYIDAAAAYGADAIQEIQKQSKDFAEVNSINAWVITEVLLKMPGTSALGIAVDLYSRHNTLQQLIGAVVIAHLGVITEPSVLFDSLVKPEEEDTHGLLELALEYMDKNRVDAFLFSVITKRPCSYRRCCEACGILSSRAPAGSIATLTECLSDPDFPAVASALYALHYLGHEGVAQLALERLAKGLPTDEAESLILLISVLKRQILKRQANAVGY